MISTNVRRTHDNKHKIMRFILLLEGADRDLGQTEPLLNYTAIFVNINLLVKYNELLGNFPLNHL